MLALSTHSAPHLVAAHLGWPEHSLTAVELSGGVSSTVVRVSSPYGDLVLKQSLAKLRVAEDWFSEQARIFDEIDALRALGPQPSLPQVLFEQREDFLFAMTAASPDAPTWKQLLLAGQADSSLALQAAALHACFFRAPAQAARFDSLTRFDQLRLDPYYRRTAQRHPDLAPHFDAAILQAQTQRCALTHGDWSPKNFLVNPGPCLFSIDYEVMHWGDPSFDSAFLLNHFLLKGWHRAGAQPLYAALAQTYIEELIRLSGAAWLEAATLRHLGCLHLARVDGKSPAGYLNEVQRLHVRRFARDLIQNPLSTVREVFERQAEAFHE